jgi:hypothetical protein
MAFYNDGTFQSMISLIAIFGLGFAVLWFIAKIIYALFCFDIRKIYNDNNTNNAIDTIDNTNDTNIIDSIVQVNNPFQDAIVVSVQPQQSINNDNIPIAEQV